jgi:AcrR family transcriptional regulator
MRNADRRSKSLDALLDASLQVLQSVGYARLRTADVTKRTEMSEGALFRYFPTKYALVAASLERALADHIDRLVVEFEAIKDTINRRTLMEMLWNVLAHPELRWTYELYAAAATDEELSRLIRPVLLANSDNIDKFARSVIAQTGYISADDATKAANLLTWVMQGLVLNDMARGTTGRQVDLIDYLEFLADQAYPSTTDR